ncbi:hypothetical protein VNO80_14440 [Phaseolus coccineus]|uniref:Uncharacterized protein n=1 Tax=Phaseolus coccineus TaxID=3886 RepID=A0AAN9MNE3_PHACN
MQPAKATAAEALMGIELASVIRQPTAGYQDNVQGHFPINGFSSWPVHSPPGALPMFQPYPVQGIPYYQTYPGNNPLMQPVSSPMEDSRLNASPNVGHVMHSMNNEQLTESETRDEMAMEREGSLTGERRKKADHSGRHRYSMVVIRNINYITKTERSSGCGSCSDYSSETGEEKEQVTDSGKEADGGQCLAFQKCLLRGVDEDRHAVDQDKFDHVRRKKHVVGNDPIDFTERNMHEAQGGRDALDMQRISNGLTYMPRSPNDGFLLSRSSGQSVNGRVPKVHKKEENNSNYQPDELSLMPERGAEKGAMDYNHAFDLKCRLRLGVVLCKIKRTKHEQRVERLRNYKADLQKMKKEKMERQRRIAARSNSITTKLSTPPQRTKKQIPVKLSPSSYKGSKFSDLEPGSSSPFQRFPIRTASVGSNDSSKAPKTSRLNTNKLSRSAPSLPESKQEKGDGTTDTKA